MPSRVMVVALWGALLCVTGSPAGAGGNSSETALREHYDLQDGKRLYEQNCQLCHGAQGTGKAYEVTPPPADLTSPAVQRKSDVELAQTIHEGERGTAMGAWKWTLSEKEKQQLLLYIRWLAR